MFFSRHEWSSRRLAVWCSFRGTVTGNVILARYRVTFHLEAHSRTLWGCMVSSSESAEVSPDILSVISGSLEFGVKITNRVSPVGKNTAAKWRFGAVRHWAWISLDGVRATFGHFKFVVFCRKLIKFLIESIEIESSSGFSLTTSLQKIKLEGKIMGKLDLRSFSYIINLVFNLLLTCQLFVKFIERTLSSKNYRICRMGFKCYRCI